MYQTTLEHYQSKLREKYPEDKLTVLSFTKTYEPAEIRCDKCGKIYRYQRATTIYSGRRKHFCKICNTKSVKKIYEACEKYNFSIKERTENVTNNWLLTCNKCKKDFTIIPSDYNIHDCPHCGAASNARTKEEAQYKIDEVFGKGEFKILDEPPYTRRIVVKHKCGFVRKTQFGAFIHSKGCSKCNKNISKGEALIISYLEKNNIPYVFQAPLNNSRQTFDFLLDNDKAIEYNGEQHYKPIMAFGGEERFLSQKELDTKKREYCKENNIQLLVIPYWEQKNIDTLLDTFLKGSTTNLNGVNK